MSPDRLVLLITKQLSASLSAEEAEELQQLLREDDHRQAYQLLHKFWHQQAEAAAPDKEKALARVLENIREESVCEVAPLPRQTPDKKQLPLRKAVVAAAALVVLAAGYWRLAGRNTPTQDAVALKPAVPTAADSVVEKQNAKGTRSIIILADGSKVWLNADSRLQYPVAFEGATREVELSGEAFFDVAKNKQKPFIIRLKKGMVKVLGTSFNIKAYDDAPLVETSVATGRVVFIPGAAAGGQTTDSIVLTHDRKAVYHINAGTVETLATSSATDKAWTEGKLIFDQSPIEEIAAVLERNFGKQVIINDEELKSYRFTGSFANDRIEDILYYLSKSKPFTYRITETQVTLSALQ